MYLLNCLHIAMINHTIMVNNSAKMYGGAIFLDNVNFSFYNNNISFN